MHENECLDSWIAYVQSYYDIVPRLHRRYAAWRRELETLRRELATPSRWTRRDLLGKKRRERELVTLLQHVETVVHTRDEMEYNIAMAFTDGKSEMMRDAS